MNWSARQPQHDFARRTYAGGNGRSRHRAGFEDAVRYLLPVPRGSVAPRTIAQGLHGDQSIAVARVPMARLGSGRGLGNCVLSRQRCKNCSAGDGGSSVEDDATFRRAGACAFLSIKRTIGER